MTKAPVTLSRFQQRITTIHPDLSKMVKSGCIGMSLHLSKCHIVGNHMSLFICTCGRPVPRLGILRFVSESSQRPGRVPANVLSHLSHLCVIIRIFSISFYLAYILVHSFASLSGVPRYILMSNENAPPTK